MMSRPFAGLRPSRRLRRAWIRFRRATAGVAAVEFALILPLMLLIYLGSAETTQAVVSARKATLAAQAMADIVAQTYTSAAGGAGNLTDSTLGNVFNAAAMLMQPYSTGTTASGVVSLKLNISAISFTQYTSNASSGSNSYVAAGVAASTIWVPSQNKTGTQFPAVTSTDPGFAAKVRWMATPATVNASTANSTTLSNSSALSRVCSNTGSSGSKTGITPLTPDPVASNAAAAGTLQTNYYPATGAGNSLILADVQYNYTPTFGASVAQFAWSQSTTSPLTTNYTIGAVPRDSTWGTTPSCGNSVDGWVCYAPATRTGNTAATCAYN
jgi:Flp pilus assembly protein TadG